MRSSTATPPWPGRRSSRASAAPTPSCTRRSMSEPFDRPEVVAASQAWASTGQWIGSPNGQGWCARLPPLAETGNPPLLVLHGFPTCSYDWKGVLPALRAGRDVVILDVTGFGLSDKPDHRYSIRGYAD